MDPYNNLPTQNYHLYQKYCNIQGQQQLPPPPPPQQQQQDYYYHQQPPQLPYYPSLSNHHRPFLRHRFDAPILPEPVLRDTLLRDSRRDDVFFSDDVFGQSSGQSRNRRGVRLFNGGRNFDSHGSPPFHDREYNRGRYKGSMFNDSASGLSNVASSSESGVAKMSQVPAAKVKPSTRQPWCELCRIFCSSAKTMEDHMNGKRHKANLIEEGKSHKQKVNIGLQNSSQRSDFEYKADTRQSGKVDKYKEMQTQMENIQPEKVIAAPERAKKRPRTGDQGCKFVRSNDGARRPVNLKKPKQQTAFTCELCNVMCGSKVDFQSHLNGKKHFLNLELSREKQDASGSSSSNAPSMKKHFVKPELFRDNKDALGSVSVNDVSMSSKSQFQQQENTLITLSQLTSVHSQSQALEEPGAAAVADLVPTPPQGPHLEIQQCQQSQIHGSESDIEVGGAVAVSENFETKQQSVTMMPEDPPSSSNEQDFPATESNTSLPTDGCEFVSSNHGVNLSAKSYLEEQMSEDDHGEYLEDPVEDPEENPEEDSEEDPEEATIEDDPEEDPEEATIEEDPKEDPEETILEEDPEEYPEDATIEEDPEEDLEETILEEDPEENPEETILEEDPGETYLEEDPEEYPEEDPKEAVLEDEEDPEEDPEEYPEEDSKEALLEDEEDPEEDPEEYPEDDPKEALLEDEEDPEEDPEEMIPEDEDPEEYEEEDPDEDPTEQQ